MYLRAGYPECELERGDDRRDRRIESAAARRPPRAGVFRARSVRQRVVVSGRQAHRHVRAKQPDAQCDARDHRHGGRRAAHRPNVHGDCQHVLAARPVRHRVHCAWKRHRPAAEASSGCSRTRPGPRAASRTISWTTGTPASAPTAPRSSASGSTRRRCRGPSRSMARADRASCRPAIRRHCGVSRTNDNRILFTTPVKGEQQIWMMDADGSNRRPITTEGGSGWPRLSPRRPFRSRSRVFAERSAGSGG